MTSKNTGLALVLVASLFAFACGGDDSSPGGDGGSGATGGSSGGSGGATGGSTTGGSTTGGSTTGGSTTGGTGGTTGGAGTLEPFACPGDLPEAPEITNFDTVMADGMWGDPMMGLAGGIFNYGSVEHEVVDGALHVSGNVTGFSGAGLYINNCSDVSKYDGIEFTVTGDAGGMDMTFQLQTNEDYPIAIDPMTQGNKGACDHDEADTMDDFAVCASPQKTFMAPGTVTVLFSELTGGKPNVMADPTQVLGIQWQFAWSDTASPYDVDVTIDDVQFITAP